MSASVTLSGLVAQTQSVEEYANRPIALDARLHLAGWSGAGLSLAVGLCLLLLPSPAAAFFGLGPQPSSFYFAFRDQAQGLVWLLGHPDIWLVLVLANLAAAGLLALLLLQSGLSPRWHFVVLGLLATPGISAVWLGLFLVIVAVNLLLWLLVGLLIAVGVVLGLLVVLGMVLGVGDSR